MPSLIVRIDLGEAGRIGPGKVLLLEMIAAHGSISAAGRAMDLPYRHAWELVEQLNATFTAPVVARKTGGKRGGGAALTPFGADLLRHLVALRAEAEKAASPHLGAIAAALKPQRALVDGAASSTPAGGRPARTRAAPPRRAIRRA